MKQSLDMKLTNIVRRAQLGSLTQEDVEKLSYLLIKLKAEDPNYLRMAKIGCGVAITIMWLSLLINATSLFAVIAIDPNSAITPTNPLILLTTIFSTILFHGEHARICNRQKQLKDWGNLAQSKQAAELILTGVALHITTIAMEQSEAKGHKIDARYAFACAVFTITGDSGNSTGLIGIHPDQAVIQAEKLLLDVLEPTSQPST